MIRIGILLAMLLPSAAWSVYEEIELAYGTYDVLQNPWTTETNIVLRGNISDLTDTVYDCETGTGNDEIALNIPSSTYTNGEMNRRLAILLTAVATKSDIRILLHDSPALRDPNNPHCIATNIQLIVRD